MDLRLNPYQPPPLLQLCRRHERYGNGDTLIQTFVTSGHSCSARRMGAPDIPIDSFVRIPYDATSVNQK